MPKKKRTNIIFAIFKGVYLTAKIISLGTYRLLKKTTETKPKKTKRIKSLPTIDPFKQIHTESGNLQDFENFLINKPSTIGIILGARGTGKSAIGMRLLENIHSQKNRKCYAMGFKDLPKWIKVVENIEEIKNNSLVLIDEGGILFSSRDSMKNANKLLTELLLIARHKDLQILFISQSSANLEINAIRQADYLILKPSSLLQKDFERKKIKEIYTEIEEKFNQHKELKGMPCKQKPSRKKYKCFRGEANYKIEISFIELPEEDMRKNILTPSVKARTSIIKGDINQNFDELEILNS